MASFGVTKSGSISDIDAVRGGEPWREADGEDCEDLPGSDASDSEGEEGEDGAPAGFLW